MTASDNQAIAVLTDMFKQFMQDNADAHRDIKQLISETERRLCNKIEARDAEIKAIVAHCREREIEVDAILAKREEKFEGEIQQARMAAIEEARKPSVIRQAGGLLGRRFWRLVLGLAVVLGLISTLLLVLERFSVIG